MLPIPSLQLASSPYFPNLIGNYSGVQAEGYKLSRKARTKPFNTFSVSTTLGSSRDESSLRKKPSP
jgi:hypothetical protein